MDGDDYKKNNSLASQSTCHCSPHLLEIISYPLLMRIGPKYTLVDEDDSLFGEREWYDFIHHRVATIIQFNARIKSLLPLISLLQEQEADNLANTAAFFVRNLRNLLFLDVKLDFLHRILDETASHHSLRLENHKYRFINYILIMTKHNICK